MRVLLAIAFLLVAAPAALADEQADLDAAKARWAAGGLTDYRFHVRRACFCPPEYTREYQVDVVAGEAFHAPESVAEIDTVPELFAVIQKQIDGEGTVSATYADSGLPTRIAADPIPMAADDEFGITTRDLTATDGAKVVALAKARKRWEAEGFERYRYRLEQSGKPTGTVTVYDGSEPSLFAEIDRAISAGSTTLKARYGTRGFPRRVIIAPGRQYRASRLRALR